MQAYYSVYMTHKVYTYVSGTHGATHKICNADIAYCVHHCEYTRIITVCCESFYMGRTQDSQGKLLYFR